MLSGNELQREYEIWRRQRTFGSLNAYEIVLVVTFPINAATAICSAGLALLDNSDNFAVANTFNLEIVASAGSSTSSLCPRSFELRDFSRIFFVAYPSTSLHEGRCTVLIPNQPLRKSPHNSTLRDQYFKALASFPNTHNTSAYRACT